MRTKLVLLDLLVNLFAWAWLAAGAIALYLLHGAVTSDDSWRNTVLAVTAMIGAKLAADVLGRNRQRVDYVHKLLRRGYSRAEACAAWRTAHGGGFNLLLSLQQAEAVHLGVPADTGRAINRPR
jgi:hypothetical protein